MENETQLYQIQYTDNTYRLVNWTDEEFEKVTRDWVSELPVSILKESKAALALKDIRAIVIIPQQEETEEKRNDEWDFVDQETKEYLRAIGVEVGGKEE